VVSRLDSLRVSRVFAWLFVAATLALGAKRLEIHIQGEKAFNLRRVQSLLELPEQTSGWEAEDWESWAEDAGPLLAEAYHDEGYFDARVEVSPLFVDSTNAGKGLAIDVKIFEGPRYRFGAVDIHLAKGNFPQYNPSDLSCRTAKPFDKSFVYSDQRDLLKFYGDAGFLKAQAAESLFYDTSDKLVNVAFHVDPRQALVFDTLTLHIQREGDTTGLPAKTSTKLLRSLFTLHRGDTLSLSDINDFERKLKSTRAYSFVRIRDSLLPDAGGRSALILNAEEKVPGELEASGFWENQYGLGGSVDWSQDNMGGHLQEGHTTVSLAQRKQSLYLGYGAPLVFGTLVRFDNDFLVDWYQDASQVQGDGWFHGNFDISNESKLSKQFLPWLRVVSGAELLGTSTLSDSGVQRDFNLNYITSVYLEQVDDPVNPTLGARVGLTWGNGGPVFEHGGLSIFDNRANWFEADNAGYLPIAPWLVAALRLDGGRFYGDGGINSERFYLGGPTSVRSVDWRTVCPQYVAGICNDNIEPAYFLTSLELRFSPFLPSWISPDGRWAHLIGLQIVPFADYGNIWQVGQSLTATGEGRAVGLGLRYVFLSLFNIRVDYAFDPRDNPRDISDQRVILDLSQAF